MKSFQKTFQAGIHFLTCPPQQKNRLSSWIFISLLYLAGLACWGAYFNWGDWPLTFHDWANITAPRLTFLKNAVLNGQLPLHLANRTMVGELRTTRFMAIPDILLSPQALLLRYLNVNQFALFQVCFLFTLGFLGLVWLRRVQKYSLLTFSVAFLLYNFNGHILAHLSVGHLTWAGYFLFSWFAVLVFELLGGAGGWLWAAKMSLLLFFILLQGGFHQWLWLLIFIGLLGICYPRHFWLLAGTGILAVLLGMVRLLPAASLLGASDTVFIGGYPDPLSILKAMIQIDLPGQVGALGGLTQDIGLWEVTIYTGSVGAAFLIYFGVIRTLLDREAAPGFRRLLLPVLGLCLLSLDRVFHAVQTILPVPLFTGERVSSRIISLAIVFLLFLAAYEFQKWLDASQSRPILTTAAVLLALFGAWELFQNFSKWTLLQTAQAFKVERFYPYRWSVANDFGDILYIRLILIGLVMSVASLVFLLVMVWKEKRKKTLSQTVEGLAS